MGNYRVARLHPRAAIPPNKSKSGAVMQCQNCGSDVRKGLQICPACGEEAAVYTSALPKQAQRTTTIDPSVYSNMASSSAPSIYKESLNGQVENSSAGLKTEARVEAKAEARVDSNPRGNSQSAKPFVTSAASMRSGIACRRCKNELKAGAKFCSVCGTSIEPTFAAKVSKELTKIFNILLNMLSTTWSTTKLPTLSIILFVAAAVSVFAALFQFLIPVGVDAGSQSPLIYHLRSIEFLLLALIFVVSGSSFSKQ